jgi:hypothetical protein
MLGIKKTVRKTVSGQVTTTQRKNGTVRTTTTTKIGGMVRTSVNGGKAKVRKSKSLF